MPAAPKPPPFSPALIALTVVWLLLCAGVWVLALLISALSVTPSNAPWAWTAVLLCIPAFVVCVAAIIIAWKKSRPALLLIAVFLPVFALGHFIVAASQVTAP